MSKPRTNKDFQETLRAAYPPEAWPEALRALWYDANDDWEASHNIAQEMHSNLGSWIHAYLHRKEGDEFNAGYWYGRANKPFPKVGLKEEHEYIVKYLLNQW